MAKHQFKNTINISHYKMPLVKPCKPNAIGPEKWNISEAQDKDLKLLYKFARDP